MSLGRLCQSPDFFKAKLYTLSKVPPENQTIMLRGGTLKDDWTPFIGKIKPGQQIMMMGTAAENVAQVPDKPEQWLEESPMLPNEPVYDGPPGFVNLGNTCYMNASLQCLAAVPELKQSLVKFNAAQSDEVETNITRGLKELFHVMDNSRKAIQPIEFLVMFRSAFPRFAEMKNGKYVQQDAEEFWSQLMDCLRRLPKLEHSDHVPGRNAIEQLFEIGFREELSCTENPDEPKKITTATATKLQCHIQGGKTPTTQLFDGIGLSMHEQLEKVSPSLNKSCIYQKEMSISKLPYYLTIQFVRFFWKKTAEKKAKIVRPVDFPMTLDLYKYCTPELQSRLLPNRLTPEEKEKGINVPGSKPVAEPIAPAPYVNSTSIYELYGVVTHQGHSADGGHYVSWVRQSQDPNDWLEFDDKDVAPKKEEDIKKLNGSGGAQWHIAYLCLYRSKSPY